MPAKRTDLDTDDIVQRYLSGMPATKIAEEVGADWATVRKQLVAAGVPIRTRSEMMTVRMSTLTAAERAAIIAPAHQGRKGARLPGKRKPVDASRIVERFLAGESVNALAETFDIARSGIVMRLREAGIEPRTRRQAMLTRMGTTDAAERVRLTDAARAACVSNRQDTLSVVGWGEDTLRSWLASRGYDFVPQLAMGPYNIDLALAPVAVEVWNSPAHPFRIARSREKTEYLRERGWSVIWVWIRRDHVFDETVADEIVTEFDRACRNPSAPAQQRVIRGSGKDAPIV